jgi:hypothetical protein
MQCNTEVYIPRRMHGAAAIEPDSLCRCASC